MSFRAFRASSGRVRLGRVLFAALLAPALWFAPDALLAQDAGEQIFEFEVQLAPVCLDGAFPISIVRDDATLAGTLDVTTTVSGAVSGTLTLVGTQFDVSGRVKHSARKSKLNLTAVRGKDRIRLAGTLDNNPDLDVPPMFTGTAKGSGKSGLFKGKRDLIVDVSGAAPQIASFTTAMTVDEKNRLGGAGSVQVCGAPLDLTISGKVKKRSKLILRGDSFKFTGKGGPSIDVKTPLSWKAKGYGAAASADGLSLALVVPPSNLVYGTLLAQHEADEPIAPNKPQSAGSAVLAYSVVPALPAGLVFNTTTGVLSGTPATTSPLVNYTVTASNLAGETAGAFSFSIRTNRSQSLVAYPGPLSADDMRHFLARTQFSVEDEPLARLKSQGLAAFIDDMLVFEQDTQVERDAFRLLQNESDPVGFEGGFPSDRQLANWWVHLMIHNDNPFQESLALFWQDHFAINTETFPGNGRRHWMVQYANLLRHQGNGSFRDLVLDVSREPAMLTFLDNLDNRDGRPNENFARELWELYMLGVDNGYSQVDIEESARAFTGYRLRLDADTSQYYVEYLASRHDGGEKTFFGQTIAAQDANDDFEAVVDITLQQRDPEYFICRKLFEWFVFPEPDEALVKQLGDELRANDWNLAPMLRTMFRSEAFFSPRARNALVKSPLDYGVGFIRATGLELPESELDVKFVDLGQRVTQPPTVDGWTNGTQWFSAQSMLQRTNLIHAVIEDTVDQQAKGILVEDLLPPIEERTSIGVVNALANRLGVTLSTADVNSFIEYLNTVQIDEAGTLVDSPLEDATEQQLDVRVRGLLYALAQHPTYHIK